VTSIPVLIQRCENTLKPTLSGFVGIIVSQGGMSQKKFDCYFSTTPVHARETESFARNGL